MYQKTNSKQQYHSSILPQGEQRYTTIRARFVRPSVHSFVRSLIWESTKSGGTDRCESTALFFSNSVYQWNKEKKKRWQREELRELASYLIDYYIPPIREYRSALAAFVPNAFLCRSFDRIVRVCGVFLPASISM